MSSNVVDNRRMGDFEKDLFNVVDSILLLLGHRPKMPLLGQPLRLTSSSCELDELDGQVPSYETTPSPVRTATYKSSSSTDSVTHATVV